MNKLNNIKLIIIIMFLFILLHEPFLIFSANLFTMFKKDNRLNLIENTYKNEIYNLKENINFYNEADKNLNISNDASLVLAKISIRNILSFYDYLIINTTSTVNNKDAVLNENGLVGFISSHSKNTAKVRLLTNKKKLSIRINNSYGLLGDYNHISKRFKVYNINNINEIKEGDKVTTSGLSKEAPNLYIGKVIKVKKDINPVVYVKSDVDFNNLNYLFVRSSI